MQYVWVIDPQGKTAWSYSSEGKRETARVLTTDSPRLTLDIAEVFAALEEDLEL